MGGHGSGDTLARVDATARFAQLMATPEHAVHVDEVALLIAAHARPSLDLDGESGRLDALAQGVRTPTLDGLRAHLFDDLGFRGNRREYYDPANSYLDQVVRRRLGIAIPVYPVKGYSLTIPITDEAMAPVSTVMDETYKTAITRLGDRIRVGGTAEVAGFDTILRPGRRAALEHSYSELFQKGGDAREAKFWCGLRPMTPDGPPILGVTSIGGLYLNTGHGTLGWTMACGSAKVLADMISGEEPAVDVSGLGIGRYS